ncbi:MAG: hypothetical protein IJH53_02815 [Oscillospiraceae bacterium]|nr:hypothetical protein [Oscillospiraceae bacterium]
MNSMEFALACREYNIMYRDRFGEIPIPGEYACTRSEFLDALKKAVSEEKPIETYLLKRVRHDDGRLE